MMTSIKKSRIMSSSKEMRDKIASNKELVMDQLYTRFGKMITDGYLFKTVSEQLELLIPFINTLSGIGVQFHLYFDDEWQAWLISIDQI